jgi:septum formation protein
LTLLLASSSPTRRALLAAARVPHDHAAPALDEVQIRLSLQAEGASPRDIADTLAEMKAQRLSLRHPGPLVLGADQVLEFQGQALGKPADRTAARDQLLQLSGQRHMQHAAAVICRDGQPEWRFIGKATLTMRTLSPDWIEGYLDRNLPDILGSAGAYQIEGEGMRLFSRIEGDHFSILGLPMIELLSYLTLRGIIDG